MNEREKQDRYGTFQSQEVTMMAVVWVKERTQGRGWLMGPSGSRGNLHLVQQKKEQLALGSLMLVSTGAIRSKLQ